MAEKTKNMPNAHLHDLLIEELQLMLNVEKKLEKALEKMAEAAKEESLKKAFQDHQEETKGHVEKIKEIFKALGASSRSRRGKAVKGLIDDAERIIEEFEGSEASDAALISAAQKVEHYEIASYGCMVTYADLMKHDKAKNLLEEILKEEKEADEKLSHIAYEKVNEA